MMIGVVGMLLLVASCGADAVRAAAGYSCAPATPTGRALGAASDPLRWRLVSTEVMKYGASVPRQSTCLICRAPMPSRAA